MMAAPCSAGGGRGLKAWLVLVVLLLVLELRVIRQVCHVCQVGGALRNVKLEGVMVRQHVAALRALRG